MKQQIFLIKVFDADLIWPPLWEEFTEKELTYDFLRATAHDWDIQKGRNKRDILNNLIIAGKVIVLGLTKE